MDKFKAERDDVLLKPIAGLRGKRNSALPKGTLYAVIWLAEDTLKEYSHPELTLFVEGQQFFNNEMYYDRRNILTVRFQRDCSDTKRHARGFMRGKSGRNHWSKAYGPQILSESFVNLKRLQAGIELVERAYEAVSYQNNARLSRAIYRADDEIVTLIAGLQRVGVTVVIRNGRRSNERG